MHIATRDLNIAFRNGEVINPVERGHIAFRTDDIEAYKRHLDEHGVHYSDYGTTFAAEWHQLFFLDPEVSERTRGGLVAWLLEPCFLWLCSRGWSWRCTKRSHRKLCEHRQC